MSHGKMLKGSGTQVVFSVLPAGDWDPRRRRQTDQVKWLCGQRDLGSENSDTLLRDWAY